MICQAKSSYGLKPDIRAVKEVRLNLSVLIAHSVAHGIYHDLLSILVYKIKTVVEIALQNYILRTVKEADL